MMIILEWTILIFKCKIWVGGRPMRILCMRIKNISPQLIYKSMTNLLGPARVISPSSKCNPRDHLKLYSKKCAPVSHLTTLHATLMSQLMTLELDYGHQWSHSIVCSILIISRNLIFMDHSGYILHLLQSLLFQVTSQEHSKWIPRISHIISNLYQSLPL